MEKRRPTYDLQAFKTAMSVPTRLAITLAAFGDAQALGFDRAGVVEVIQSMTPRHFYKSMTSYEDHTQWQDVYHVPAQGIVLYVKFRADVVTDFRVPSFKER